MFISKCETCLVYFHLSCLQIKRVENNNKSVHTFYNYWPILVIAEFYWVETSLIRVDFMEET
jgi:hypothetical protein